MPETPVRITEIFFSLQGETRTVGLPTVFVRLTGCPLRCVYCDTTYAFSGGERMSIAEVVERVDGYGARHVTVTGGEPLAQKACLPLLAALCDQGYEVSLETGGAHDVSAVDPRVVRVVDLKTPGSGEVSRNLYGNIDALRAGDQLKFVITDQADYDWAVAKLNQYRLAERCEILFSPVAGSLDPAQLAEWILRDRLPVRFQLQLHKLLWGDSPGR
ncbi:7-carboxy-7-deazaguanine synthase QueE [Methylococcus mesophilus]|uniref:7-carboxy-7-deazaguanine synthase QueE n=1 Tax=Methylococcus mesophilus TaxID=2993564 RepID=UPI00224ABF66|nr:7-carboxy-7-deazaguanine synthase QueE [Methylococcus mesophilus]UZR29810.1 7-carboxy-7-deazaguanine synthase QueE [Methylococcus mesophilus]